MGLSETDLKYVKGSVYLGTTLTERNEMDIEIAVRIKSAAATR